MSVKTIKYGGRLFTVITEDDDIIITAVNKTEYVTAILQIDATSRVSFNYVVLPNFEFEKVVSYEKQ